MYKCYPLEDKTWHDGYCWWLARTWSCGYQAQVQVPDTDEDVFYWLRTLDRLHERAKGHRAVGSVTP